MRLRVVVRLLTIQRALVRHGLDELIRATHLYSPFRFLFYLSPWTWFQRSAGDTRGQAEPGAFRAGPSRILFEKKSCKPGSVEDDHSSRRIIADPLKRSYPGALGRVYLGDCSPI